MRVRGAFCGYPVRCILLKLSFVCYYYHSFYRFRLSKPIRSKNFNIEEAVVVASPKETAQLRRQPVSVSLFANEGLKNRNIKSVNDLAAYAPNFFMPDYGSRITSACYIRGIGSRINTPAVGLYVDNVPFTDKSAYHFDFRDVVRVDVLRGPQGTLYGRNTMGGLIRVFTADPITQSGTMLHAGWTSRTGGRRFSGTTFLHPADRMGLSLECLLFSSQRLCAKTLPPAPNRTVNRRPAEG